MSARKTNAELYRISNEIYDEAFASGQNEHERVLMNDKSRQHSRFRDIYRFMEARDGTVLDVGCGNGEFLDFIAQQGHTGKYTGLDINDNLLNEARTRFPHGEFLKFDILASVLGSFDYVVMSGLFNKDFGQDDAFVESFVRAMFAHCSGRAIFNAISTYVSRRDEGMYYVDPRRMTDFVARELTGTFELRHGVVSYNYTMCLHKPRP